MPRLFLCLIATMACWVPLPSAARMQEPIDGRDVAVRLVSTNSESPDAQAEVASLATAAEKQYYEIRSYLLADAEEAVVIDDYLSQALLPALQRQQVGPVGVFTNSANDQTGSPRIVVVIPYDDVAAIAAIKAGVEADQEYQSAAKVYLDRGPSEAPYRRIESELLVAMNCMPELLVPEGTLENRERVYELRVYESANERLGNLKVEMFNSGEVPIFLDCKIQPIFIGQAMVGPFTPNLTYLTMYSSEAAREQSWLAFRDHPDWQVLKDVKKYQGTVSKIHKYVLIPKGYSQM